MDYKKELRSVIKEYFNPNNVVAVEPYGGGLINNTYLIRFKDISYILQKINDYVFPSPVGVMHNIDLITNYIRKNDIYEGRNYRTSTLTVIATKFGENYAIVDDNYWRCYIWIDGTTYDKTEDPQVFYEAGRVIGNFQRLLDGFHTRLLNDNIKNFHNTPYRYKFFQDVVKLNPGSRLDESKKEIEFLNKHASEMGIITKALEEKKIPRRVVHNDTKLNNIMFDKEGKHALCLLDLDTVMKGSLVYDFGDALRLGASTAAEDEVDLSKVSINFELVEAFTKGFLTAIKGIITNAEVDLLMVGYKIITLELGMRFLTDYINGDKYFALTKEQKAKRPKINLERARNQFKLVSEIEKNFDKLNEIVNKTLDSLIED